MSPLLKMDSNKIAINSQQNYLSKRVSNVTAADNGQQSHNIIVKKGPIYLKSINMEIAVLHTMCYFL